jgi:hypothetical protein
MTKLILLRPFFAGILISSTFWIEVMNRHLGSPPFYLAIFAWFIGMGLFGWWLATTSPADGSRVPFA